MYVPPKEKTQDYVQLAHQAMDNKEKKREAFVM
jgi:hypothetical protein